MANSSELYFTNDEKIFAEHLNDTILLTNTFDLTIPITMPLMFDDGNFKNTTDPRKCGMAIVGLTSSLPSGISINNDGNLTGSGTVAFSFYPNFKTFGCIKKLNWTNTGSITVNLKKIDNTSIISNVTKNADISTNDELNKLQQIIIELVFSNATLTELDVILENKREARYGAKISQNNVDGLADDLIAINTKNTQQDSRLNSIESNDTQQNNRLNAIESIQSRYSLSASNYNPLIDEDISVTLTLTDMYDSPINNKSITLYRNGDTIGTQTTNSSGIATWTVTCDDWGMQDFMAGKTHCQVYVTGWRTLTTRTDLEGGTLTILRNKTHGRLILDGYIADVGPSYWKDDNDVRHIWNTFNNEEYVREISPRMSSYFYAVDLDEYELWGEPRIRALIRVDVNDFKIYHCGVQEENHNWFDREEYEDEGYVSYIWGNPDEWAYDYNALYLDCQWAIRDELL